VKLQASNFIGSLRRIAFLMLAMGSFSGAWNVEFRASAASSPITLNFQIVPRFGTVPLVFDSITNSTGAGQLISVTRLDFLLSDFELERADGTWVKPPDIFAYISAREGRTRFQLNNLPAGHYEKLRFHVGLNPKTNHKDPAEYPAGHPLNPEVNGLHWGWMGGYVFLALEGNWLRPDGQSSGYSYHLATDAQLMTIELPLAVDSFADSKIQVALNVDEIFAGLHQVSLNEATSATHSRTNDALAGHLRENIEHAFAVRGVVRPSVAKAAQPVLRTIEMASNATPYRLTISAFFPRPALPTDNPLTEEGVELGRRLFFDTRLSINDSQSCASCHQPSIAFCENKKVSSGAEGKTGTRNAMPLFNLAWKSAFFWDGRATSLREQVLQPIQNPIEMHESITNVVAKLRGVSGAQNRAPGYPSLFARAFGSPEITADRIARALEQFLLTQTSHDSKFDRILKGQAQFTDEEQRGFELFHTEYDPRREQFGADCFHCHGGPLFQNQTFANNGLDAEPGDPGRSAVTGKEGDKGKFAVPSLRNVELTAPYMHDGRFENLEALIEHYSTGVKRSATLDPYLANHPDGGVPLSTQDKRALVAFLKTLTDERFRKSNELANMP
jgi:cytochrome c peroxidase